MSRESDGPAVAQRPPAAPTTAATGAQPATAPAAPKKTYPQTYLKKRGTPWMVPFDPDPESALYGGVRKIMRVHNKAGVRTRFFHQQSASDAVGKQLCTTASALYGFHVRRFKPGKKYTTVARGPTTDHVLVFYSREPDLGPSHEWFEHLKFQVPQLRNLSWKDQPLFNVYKVNEAQHYKHLEKRARTHTHTRARAHACSRLLACLLALCFHVSLFCPTCAAGRRSRPC